MWEAGLFAGACAFQLVESYQKWQKNRSLFELLLDLLFFLLECILG
jgi:hypothetical protein